MSLANTTSSYGTVTKTLHWLTALLILAALPIGYFAQEAAFATGEELAFKATLFSLHKTVGIAAFFTALIRIIWATQQTRPGLLNTENKLETTAAEVAHWLLYGSMLLVPLTGWIHHAATQGFAPIWWPFGQDLPFVPKSEPLADLTKGLHFVLMVVMSATILAHIGGALKHFVIDRDQTLQRMTFGPHSAPEVAMTPHHRSPFVIALAIWAVALGIGAANGLYKPHAAGPEITADLQEVQSDWAVQDGNINIAIKQFGSQVTGGFGEWTAQISFEEIAQDGKHGSVDVTIAIPSLSLGSVTQQAMGSDYFDAATFPTANFVAEILPAAEGYIAEGTLTLRGTTMPLTLPFLLETDGQTASMTGAVTLNRQDFGIGDNQPDESNLGFAVDVTIELTANRG